jgi:ribonuclease-3
MIEEALKEHGSKDYKTTLQEVLQSKSDKKITYEIIDEKGPDHDKIYTAVVKWDEEILGQGQGKNKKEAEQEAAKQALKQ